MIQCESKIEKNLPNFICCFTSLSSVIYVYNWLTNRFQFSFWNVNLFRCECVSYIWYSSFHLQLVLILNIHVSSIPCVFLPCVRLFDDVNNLFQHHVQRATETAWNDGWSCRHRMQCLPMGDNWPTNVIDVSNTPAANFTSSFYCVKVDTQLALIIF